MAFGNKIQDRDKILTDRTLCLPRLFVLKETLASYSISQIVLNISIVLRYLLRGSCTPALHSVTIVFCFHMLSSFQMLFPYFWGKCEAIRRNVAENSMWKEILVLGSEFLLQGTLRFSLVCKQMMCFRPWAQLFYLSWCMTDCTDHHMAYVI